MNIYHSRNNFFIALAKVLPGVSFDMYNIQFSLQNRIEMSKDQWTYYTEICIRSTDVDDFIVLAAFALTKGQRQASW